MQSGPSRYGLRCFTPLAEVELCGHASLASVHLIFEKLYPLIVEISFKTKSGILSAKRTADLIELDFPVWGGAAIKLPIGFEAAHGCLPDGYLCSSKNIAVFKFEKNVKFFIPRPGLY